MFFYKKKKEKKVAPLDRSVGSVAVGPVSVVLFKPVTSFSCRGGAERHDLCHRQGQGSLRVSVARFYLLFYSFFFDCW